MDWKQRPRHIPPLNPLRFFEVVARTENLTLAAQELNVTQSAVSRQIAVLEAYLGVELFRRERHGVRLTAAGKDYATSIIPVFQQVSNSTRRLVSDSRSGTLRVRVYTSFAANWLIPRLGDFHTKHPDIEVELATGMRNVDFAGDAVDLAIQAGYGDWPHTHADLLFHDQIDPVCSPAYWARLQQAGSDAHCRLLYAKYASVEWEDWSSRSTHDARQLIMGADQIGFSISLLAWRAAAAGLGLAMGQLALLNEELARGELVRPFQLPVVRDSAYYLLRPKQRNDSPKDRLFRDWLLEQAAQTRTLLEQHARR